MFRCVTVEKYFENIIPRTEKLAREQWQERNPKAEWSERNIVVGSLFFFFAFGLLVRQKQKDILGAVKTDETSIKWVLVCVG